MAASSASSKSSAVASAPSATDLLTTRPTAAAASAASSPSASELPTTATRRPRGSGWWASSWATSNISSRVSTWITPACRNIASTRLRRRRDLAHGVAHRHALRRTAGLHRDDRLAQRDPARDPGELARVADRLEVEQHDLGGVVLLPVLQQVVAGDVGAVAGGDERREAEPAVVDLLEDRRARAHRTGRRSRPGRAGGITGDSEALSEIAGSVLMTPRQFGPISRSPYDRASPTSRRCRCRPSSPVSAKPEEITTRPWTPLAAQSRTTSCTASAGHRHDRDVDVVGDVVDRGVRRQAGHRVRRTGSRRRPGRCSRR